MIPLPFRSPFVTPAGRYFCGRVVIGSQARLRIWCRKAYGFESLRPHETILAYCFFCKVASRPDDTAICWYVMRDLKRTNAANPAYKMLAERGMEVFTPMKWHLSVRNGRRERKTVPVIQDLLFVHDMRKNIDPLVRLVPTLQYRFLRNEYCKPMTVREDDMNRFINAVNNSESVVYYRPEEITPQMLNRRIRIIGGPLDGYEGTLVTARGSKTKRILVELPDLLTAGIEVNPDFIQLV